MGFIGLFPIFKVPANLSFKARRSDDAVTERINLILPDMDEVGRRDVLKYAEEKKQFEELLKLSKSKLAA